LRKKISISFILLWFFFLGKTQDTLLYDAVYSYEVIEKADSTFVNELLQKADTTTSSALVLQYLLQAQNYMEEENRPSSLFDIYYRIGKIYQSEGLSNRALPFFQKAKNLPSPPISENKKIELLDPIADCYLQSEYVDSALMVYDELFGFYQRKNNYEGKLKTLQYKVEAHSQIGDFRKALDYNLQIKTLAEGRKDKNHLAIVFNNIGYNFNSLEEYKKAIQYFGYALELAEKGQSTYGYNFNSNEKAKIDLVTLYTNLGIAYNNLDNYKASIENLLNAKRENKKDSSQVSNAYLDHMIATVYFNNENIYDALNFNNSAINLAQKNKELNVLRDAYRTAAKIQEKLYDFELALDFYEKHLKVRDSLAFEDRFRRQQLLQKQFLLEKSEKEIRLLLINEAVQDQKIASLQIQQQLLSAEADKIKLEGEQRESEFQLLQSEQAIKDANLANQKLASEKAQQELVIIQQKLIAQQNERDVKEAEQAKELAEMKSAQAQAKNVEAQQKAQLAEKNEDILKLQLEEKLLLNILPLETANELKTTGIATPKEYDKVTVLFADFSNFTKISEKLSPEELIKELNECFRAFDEITEQYGLEKIKTIGDGYMCAGGIPIANDTNPTDAIYAAIEMQNYMQQRVREKTDHGASYWNMRIGIHTGHVIAGVVGTKKFAYDIWGDTVNIASRMESACEKGKINISADTREHINGQFECTYRGEVEVKHADKMGMYFVKSK